MAVDGAGVRNENGGWPSRPRNTSIKAPEGTAKMSASLRASEGPGALKKSKEFRKLMLLTAYFVFLSAVFYFLRLGQLSWYILLASALAWFGFEANGNRGRITSAMKVGAFLLVFDFIVENSGWILGLWYTKSQLAVGVVPLQVMGVALFGGAAWALYLPRKFDIRHSFLDCMVFSFFGALGERLLIGQVLFVYQLWWTSVDAFVAYFLTWVILHYVRYHVFFRSERQYWSSHGVGALEDPAMPGVRHVP